MKTSARNQFAGRVTAVRSGPVDAEVHVDIGSDDCLVSVITSESARALGLVHGKPVLALVKAPSVILVAGDEVQTSARNRFCGMVSACEEGLVDSEVIVALAGNRTVTAVIPNASMGRLGLRVGAPVCALVKASSVILAVEE